MLEKKPKKCYAGRPKRSGQDERGNSQYVNEFYWDVPECAAHEKHIIEQSCLPCPRETIVDLITRYLEVHKKHIVEADKRLVLYTDMADILYGLPEYALTLGILSIVHDPKKIFFPVVGEVKQAAEAHLIVWPDNTDPGQEPY